ncbi:hypothetical protein ACLBKS_06240, partial [Hylemonella sp. W303a]|uniref:hypothetical protein n=1 Tax=Hylemonella sp. W303a TaxID=3389873 RepID=UPI00396AF147
SATLSTSGLLTLNAGSNAITVAAGDTANFGSVNLTGGVVALTEDSAMTLAGLSATSATLTANGAITQSGAASVTGTMSLTAGSNAITLDSAGNSFGGAVTASGTSVTIDGGTGSLNVGSGGITASTGNVDLRADTQITATGNISAVNGTVILSASSAGAGILLGNLPPSNRIIADTVQIGRSGQTGVISLGGSFSTGSNLTFAQAVRLTTDVTLNTSSGNGNITFNSTVDGTVAGQQGLTLNTGSGDIAVAGDMGNGTQLEYLRVTQAHDATFSSQINLAGDFTQTGGSGTTTLDGALTVGSIDLKVSRLTLDNVALNTTGNGDITLQVDEILTVSGSTSFNAGTGTVTLAPFTKSNTVHICNSNVAGSCSGTYATTYDLGSLAITAGTIGFGATDHHGVITLEGITFGYGLEVFNDADIIVTGNLTGTAGSSLILNPGAGITRLQGGSITTQGNQTFNSNVRLNGNFVLTATNGGDINFNGTLTEATTSNLTIAQADNVTLDGSVTLTGDFEVTQASGTLTLSDGLQLKAGSIHLNANEIDRGAGSSQITLDTSDGNGGAGGDVELITDNLTITNLDIQAGNGTITLAPQNASTDMNVCSSDASSCGGPFNPGDAVYDLGNTFTFNSAATLQLGQTSHSGDINLYAISLAYDLALNTSGLITLMGNVTTSGTLDLTAGQGIEVGGGGVTRLFTINNGGVVNFNSALNAATANTESLSIVTTGTGYAVFDQAVGGVKRLANFNVNGQINNGATALSVNAGNISLSSSSTLTSSGGMTFTGGMNAANGSLLAGNVTFNAINLQGQVHSTGSQTFNGAVTLGGATTLTARNSSNVLQSVTFNGALDGQGQGLVINGNWNLQTAATGLSSLSVTGTSTLAADVTTTGAQTYVGAVSLATATRTLTAGSGQLIDMQGGLTGGGLGLNIAGGNWKLAGNATGLSSLNVAGTSTLAGDVTTTGAQTYQGAVTLAGTGTRVLQAGSGQLVDMRAGLLGAGLGLNIATGNWKLTGNATGLGSLNVVSASTLAGDVTTTGNQTYSGAVTVQGTHTLNAGGTLTLNDTVTSNAGLTLSATNLYAEDTVSAAQDLTLNLQNNLTHDADGVSFQAGTAGSGVLTLRVNQANNSAGVTLDLNGLDLSGTSIVLAGSGRDTLQGYTSGSGTWSVTGNGSGSLTHADLGTSSNVAGFSGFATLVGSDDADTFNVSGNHAGSIQGGAGDDVMRLVGSGTLGSFDGGSGADTFNITGASHPRTVVWGQDFSNVETLLGNGDVLQGSSSAGTTWSLTGANSGTITVGSAASFSGFTQINSGTGGENLFTSNGQYSGTVRLAGTNRWNFTSGARLTQGNVTGNGSLTIAQRDGQTSKSNFSISSSDLYLPNLSGFTGNLIIGGTLTPPTLPLGGSSTVVINADRLTVADALTTGGNLVLLGSDIELTGAAVTSGGSTSLIAGGSTCNGCAGLTGTGDVIVSGATNLTASSGQVIAARGIQNASALTLKFDGGDFELAVAAGQEETSQPSSLSAARSIPLTNQTQAFVNALNLQLVSVSVSFANPAAAMLGVRAIEVIDLALFEEDLTLFGRLGEGVALAFAQCEEVEGCTPNVTLEELNTALSQIQLNIQQLEAELLQTQDPERRKQIEGLLDEYRGRQKEYTAYRTDLADFTGFEAQFEDEFGKAGAAEIDMAAMEREVKVVETIYTRVRFLENLRFNQERRKLFAERTGLDLNDQRLSEIIDSTLKSATRAEARIERMLQGKNEVE